jgi:hypothetical protein
MAQSRWRFAIRQQPAPGEMATVIAGEPSAKAPGSTGAGWGCLMRGFRGE